MFIEYVPLDLIKVKQDRIRVDFGNLRQLKNSITHYGLINPILLTNDYHLVAGNRRYLVIQQLGWDKIPAIILPYQVSKLNLLEIEVEENLRRKDFSKQEIVSYKKRKYKLLYPWYKRLLVNLKNLFKRKKKK